MPGGIHNVKCRGKPRTNIFIPQPHQEFVKNYMLKTKERGLILYHRLGSGKTCTSVLVIDSLLENSEYEKAYILSPGSLRKNFIEEYCKICGKDQKTVEEKLTFITYNANVANYLPETFDNSIIVIDEAHNLVNSVKNHSKNAMAIYYRLVAAKHIKILCLTGTPLYNNPFEIAILLHLVKPGAFPNIVTDKGVNETIFQNLFRSQLSDGTLIPKDRSKFLERLSGIISYMPGLSKDFYPETIHMPIERVVMPEYQQRYYAQSIYTENKTLAQGYPPAELRFANPQKYHFDVQMYILSAKRIRSRADSNFSYPVGTRSLKDILKSKGGWVDTSSFSPGNLMRNKYSPKFVKVLENISKHFDEKHMIFSFFKTKSGVILLRTLLEMCGVSSVIFSGDLNDTSREKILRVFNSKENRYGQIYKVILVTDAGAEGITILETNNIHILESDKRENKIHQVIGRVSRYKSHINLPLEKRIVRVWRYWSVYPPLKKNIVIIEKKKGKEQKKTIQIDSTIDEILYKEGQIKMNELNSILDLLKEAAIENYNKVF